VSPRRRSVRADPLRLGGSLLQQVEDAAEDQQIDARQSQQDRYDHPATGCGIPSSPSCPSKGNDLIALDVVVSVESDVVATFLRRRGRAVVMDNIHVEKVGPTNPQYPGRENDIKAAAGLTPSSGAKTPRCQKLTGGSDLCGNPRPVEYVQRVIVTDKLRSYGLAQCQLLPMVEHRQSRRSNNRTENSHRPTRHRERQM
jgi:hypothetical protein